MSASMGILTVLSLALFSTLRSKTAGLFWEDLEPCDIRELEMVSAEVEAAEERDITLEDGSDLSVLPL